MNKICPNCKKEFSKTRSESVEYWNNKRIYCSKPCYTESMKGKDLFNDVTRNKIAWNKGIKGLKGKENPCWSRVLKNCKFCGNSFEVRKYRKETANYCSRKCKTDDNFGLTPIHERIRKSLQYENWRKSVFERDLYTCQICGEVGGKLNADHIKRFSEYPELRLELSNGRTLCESCHRLTETYGNRKLNYLLSAQET